MMLFCASAARTQETEAKPAPTSSPASTPSTVDLGPALTAGAVEDGSSSTNAAAAPKAAVPTKFGYTLPGKKGKMEYYGPDTVAVLEPTPVLDEEGKQRLDPEMKPMWNEPVKQLRDKKGHPVFDEEGKPVFQDAKDLGFDDKGHKISAKKEKPPKTIAVSVTHGTLTVDGMIGKAALNYEIKDFKYGYFYAPWVGTVVVSNAPFPGSTMQANAFSDKTLTVAVGDHSIQLYSEKVLLGKKPEPAYVLVDRSFQLPTRNAVVGYGETLKAPYAWPGAKLVAGSKIAPPIPENLRPALMLPPCPSGQMRAASTALPGETAAAQPCVAIGAVAPAKQSAAASVAKESATPLLEP